LRAARARERRKTASKAPQFPWGAEATRSSAD
jgi:hypothetical protein